MKTTQTIAAIVVASTALLTGCASTTSTPYNNGYNNGNGYYTGNAGVSAYDVTYEYGGRNYTTRTNYNPGNRIRVRVDVRPE